MSNENNKSLVDQLAALAQDAENKRQAENNPNLERIHLGMRDAFHIAEQRARAAVAADPVVEANRKLLLDRSNVGIAKYGTTLGGAGLSRRQLVQHALDLSNYLQAILLLDDALPAALSALDEGIKALEDARGAAFGVAVHISDGRDLLDVLRAARGAAC